MGFQECHSKKWMVCLLD